MPGGTCFTWRPDLAEFYVDGRFVALQVPAPSVPMGLVFWIDNYRVFWNGSFWERGFLDLDEDQYVELQHVRIYTSRARFTDAGGRDREHYTLGSDHIWVTLDDPDENRDRGAPDEALVVVREPRGGDIETLRLTETGAASGRFLSDALPLRRGGAVPQDGVIEAEPGTTLVLSYVDPDDARDTDSDEVSLVSGPDCTGDCDGDGAVTIDELVRAVAVALGTRPAADCAAIDRNGDGEATVDELVAAVAAALRGCAASPVER